MAHIKLLRATTHLDDFEYYKFVLVGDEYRMARLHVLCMSHREMVEPREKATAAGLVALLPPLVMRCEDSHSSTLNIGCSDEHLKELAKLLGRKLVNREDSL